MRYASLGARVLVLESRSHIGGNCYDEVEPESGVRVNRYGAHLFHTDDERVWRYVSRFGEWRRWEHRVVGSVAAGGGGGEEEEVLVPIPVNIDTVNALLPAAQLQSEQQMLAWLEAERAGSRADLDAATSAASTSALDGRPAAAAEVATQGPAQPANAKEQALSRVGPRLYAAIFEPYTAKQWGRPPAELAPDVTARIPVRTRPIPARLCIPCATLLGYRIHP